MYRSNRKPDFSNLVRVLEKKQPSRPTLFEFFLNEKLYMELAGDDYKKKNDGLDGHRCNIAAFRNAGYDYINLISSGFHFDTGNKKRHSTISLNDGFVITDWKSYEQYKWNHPEDYDYAPMNTLSEELPEGMKWIAYGPGGVLENVIALTGYDNLCIMVYEEPELVEQIFHDVGSRLLKYYEISLELDGLGAIISNDDWGFNTQTMLSTSDMRKYVFPWHKRIVSAAHAKGIPVILHSCGNLAAVMDDVINDMGFDGKHSYEDNILPVETAYDMYKDKIAVMGGIDVDFVCRESPEEITKRSIKMLEKAEVGGAYALGTGNSVPAYVPNENYYAMIKAVQVTQ